MGFSPSTGQRRASETVCRSGGMNSEKQPLFLGGIKQAGFVASSRTAVGWTIRGGVPSLGPSSNHTRVHQPGPGPRTWPLLIPQVQTLRFPPEGEILELERAVPVLSSSYSLRGDMGRQKERHRSGRRPYLGCPLGTKDTGALICWSDQKKETPFSLIHPHPPHRVPWRGTRGQRVPSGLTRQRCQRGLGSPSPCRWGWGGGSVSAHPACLCRLPLSYM